MNPRNSYLWQTPNRTFLKDDVTWYKNCRVGINTLGKFMATICEIVKTSRVYSNHSARVTYCSIAGERFDENNIKSVSGHKSNSSLGIYKRVRDSKKEEMFDFINSSIAKNTSTSC